jgi:hypothetical protein
MGLLYTVNLDPQRPDCLWVTGDSGLNIQNFDAFTGGNCGDGPIKILAQGFVDATVPPCPPLSYTSLQVVSPAPGTYTSATVSFLDLNNLPIAGAPDAPLDATGTVSLAGLSLNSAGGLPKFVITLVGAPTRPGAVSATLKWVGPTDPSCVVGVSPPTHLDEDNDGIENAHDPDIDGDGIRNGSDSDIDGDKVTNSKDSDRDGDGIPNGHDADANGDGVNDRTGAPTNSGSASPKPAATRCSPATP